MGKVVARGANKQAPAQNTTTQPAPAPKASTGKKEDKANLKSARPSVSSHTSGDNLHVSGSLCVNGNGRFKSDVRIDDDLHVGGSICATEDIRTRGSVRVGDSLHVEDDASVEGDLSVDGDVSIDGDLEVGGVTSLTRMPIINLSANDESPLESGDTISPCLIEGGIVIVNSEDDYCGSGSTSECGTTVYMPCAYEIVDGLSYGCELQPGDTIQFILATSFAENEFDDIVYVDFSAEGFCLDYIAPWWPGLLVGIGKNVVVYLRYTPIDECTPQFTVFATGAINIYDLCGC